MRRLRTIVALVVLCLTAAPVPADAYFWAWLDDWSGPRFMGTTVEWRIWCEPDKLQDSRALLHGTRLRIQAEAGKYDAWVAKVPAGHASVKEFQLAAAYAHAADRFLGKALDPASGAAIDEWAKQAVAWRALAAVQFRWAMDVWQGKRLDPLKKPEQPPIPTDADYETADPGRFGLRMVAAPFATVGLAVSACGSAPLQRDRQYVALKFGWAFDAKDRNDVFDHRMVTVGATYNIVATPWLTVGSGGGVAVLTSNVRDPFYKVYVEPSVVDFRPFTLGRHGGSRGAWAHVFYLRYSTLVVPTGFDLGSFGGQTERYSAELTHNLGIHADLTPVIRKLQGRW